MEAPWVLWERVAAGSGSLGAASSESAAGNGRLRGCGCCVLSRAAVSIVALSCGLCVWWVWMVVRFVCVIRVPVCARVPRLCPVCVSRLPPVSSCVCSRRVGLGILKPILYKTRNRVDSASPKQVRKGRTGHPDCVAARVAPHGGAQCRDVDRFQVGRHVRSCPRTQLGRKAVVHASCAGAAL